MESEIFGHVRGAFTGATETRPGAAELADGGTLFLDEIGEMDLGLQAKLLRFIQSGTVQRVGDATVRRVDVRIVSATNRDPFVEIAAGPLPRGSVLPAACAADPPAAAARARPTTSCSSRSLPRALSRPRRRAASRGFTPEAAERLMRHRLAGQCPRAAERDPPHGRAPSGQRGHGRRCCRRRSAASEPFGSARCRRRESRAGRSSPFWEQERSIIESAVGAFSGNIARAAAALEISPSTIYRKRQAWLEQTDGLSRLLANRPAMSRRSACVRRGGTACSAAKGVETGALRAETRGKIMKERGSRVSGIAVAGAFALALSGASSALAGEAADKAAEAETLLAAGKIDEAIDASMPRSRRSGRPRRSASARPSSSTRSRALATMSPHAGATFAPDSELRSMPSRSASAGPTSAGLQDRPSRPRSRSATQSGQILARSPAPALLEKTEPQPEPRVPDDGQLPICRP